MIATSAAKSVIHILHDFVYQTFRDCGSILSTEGPSAEDSDLQNDPGLAFQTVVAHKRSRSVSGEGSMVRTDGSCEDAPGHFFMTVVLVLG